LLEGVVKELGYQYALHNRLHFYRYLDTITAFISLGLPERSSVLDIGCGYGHICLAIKRLGHEVSGLDVDVQGAKRLPPHGIEFHLCNVETSVIPYGNERFDCILLAETIEHLDPRNLKHVLSEICRVLKPSGVLIITTPNAASIQNLIRSSLGMKILLSPDHVREYALSGLSRVLQGSGFSIIYHRFILSYDRIKGSTRESRSNDSTQPIESTLRTLGITAAKTVLYPIKLVFPHYRSLILVLLKKTETE